MRRISEQQKAPLISIIVPVYQVKEYLGECVESLLAQTYKNLEILLVDDGSTDGSGEICDQYAGRDDRVRVVHQENQGLSAARNSGIDHMKGEYAAFVDSDDVVFPDFINTLYGLAEKYQADIAACAYIKCPTEDLAEMKRAMFADAIRDENGNRRRKRAERLGKEKALCMTSEQMLRQWHGKYKKWETVAWNKLYRKSLLTGEEQKPVIRFPIGRRHEDVLTSHLLVANAERIVITRRALYLYRIRPGSITDHRSIVRHRDENLCAQRERLAFFKKKRYLRAYFNLWVGYAMHWGWFWGRRVIGLKRP